MFESHNPATGELVWKGVAASSSDIDKAIQASRRAFKSWSLMPFDKRRSYLESFRDALHKTQEELSEAISKETGKPLWESKNEVVSMINKVGISIEAYRDRCKEISSNQKGALSITRHKPYGVVAVFGPFNFPGHLPNGHIVPALLAGNTVLFKPSEYTPLVAELTSKCWKMTDIPDDVIQVLQGGSETGRSLANNPGIDGLFFTGSYSTGKILAEAFAKHPGKILALEMGGNNPLVVSDIKDLKAAANLVIQSSYLTSGQRCTCARRLIVVDNDAFILELTEEVKKITVGAYTDRPEPFMGPVISEAAANHLLAAQEKMIAKGGESLVKMQLLKPGTGLLSPGLIDVTAVKERADEEYFGPFLQVIRVPTFEKAIEEANRTTYGLAAGLCSDSRDQYQKFYDSVRAGIVNWNMPLTGASSAAPFGGVGNSGNCRPSAYYAADYCAYPVASMEMMPKVP